MNKEWKILEPYMDVLLTESAKEYGSADREDPDYVAMGEIEIDGRVYDAQIGLICWVEDSGERKLEAVLYRRLKR